jgi:hypothetical protein
MKAVCKRCPAEVEDPRMVYCQRCAQEILRAFSSGCEVEHQPLRTNVRGDPDRPVRRVRAEAAA